MIMIMMMMMIIIIIIIIIIAVIIMYHDVLTQVLVYNTEGSWRIIYE